MRILIPIISFGKSGGMKVLSNLTNHWVRQGHSVTILTAIDDVPYYPLLSEVTIVVAKSKCTDLGGGAWCLFQRLRTLFKYIRKESLQFDAIIANYNLTAYPVAFASKTKGFYYIQAYEPEFSDDMGGNFFRRNVLRFLAWFSYFLPLIKIVNSNAYTNYKNIKTNNVVFPGIDFGVYFSRERKYKRYNEEFVIGCIGRTEEWKGSNDVSRAIEILHSKGVSNVKLLVAFNPVHYLKHELIIPDGDVELSDFYRSLDLLITPGHIQLNAIHYPVIEGMATKTPLITTGYYPSSDENSFLVPIQSPEKIAETIEYIINHYDKAILKADKAFDSMNEFSWEKTSRKFMAILKKNV